MRSLTQIPLDVNPLQADALSALADFLEDRHYSPHMTGRILRSVGAHGTLAGSGIEPEDEADAEAVFVGNLPEIGFDAEVWNREDVFLDVELMALDRHPLPFGDGPDAPDADPAIHFPGTPSLADRLGIRPIAGGSPQADEPFRPTAEDLADYAAWAAELDARRDQEDFYRRHPIAEFNRIRPDA